MPKGYMLFAHRKTADAVTKTAYGELAGPAIEAAGGRFIARSGRVEARENGIAGRTVLIEFDNFEAAVAAYECDAYQKALEAMDEGADRDVRLFEGV